MKKHMKSSALLRQTPFNGKISNESPIAQGLIGRKVGDKVTISTPGGEMKIKITKVEG